jgi:hypothetical protein
MFIDIFGPVESRERGFGPGFVAYLTGRMSERDEPLEEPTSCGEHIHPLRVQNGKSDWPAREARSVNATWALLEAARWRAQFQIGTAELFCVRSGAGLQ